MNLTIEVKVKPDKFQELYQTLQALLPSMRKEKGCHDSHIYRDVEDGDTFFLSMHWEKQENLEKYMRSNSGSALLGAVDLLSGELRIKIGEDSPWEGIEFLRRMKREA